MFYLLERRFGGLSHRCPPLSYYLKIYFMKNLSLILLFTLALFSAKAQYQPLDDNLPEFHLEKAEMEAHLRFIASDEMMGRRTGTIYNNLAARYLAEKLREYGVQEVAGANGYLQEIPFVKSNPPANATVQIGENKYDQGKDLVMLSGNAMDGNAAAIFAGQGWINEETGHNDYEGIDVNGKIVVVLSGSPDSQNPFSAFKAMPKKRAFAAERGALALIEIYQIKFPWGYFKRFMNKERMSISGETESEAAKAMPYGWINEPSKELISSLSSNEFSTPAVVKSSGSQSTPSPAYNVVGLIPGSDENLKEEVVLLSAHYDHVGAGKEGGGRYTEQDSIFNGARDNGMGTIALLAAAKSLAQKPAKRSTLILWVTGEEMGLLGSDYYVENPLIPLDKIIFNLNSDGAGYNDTKYYSVIGYGRTGTDAEIEQAAQAFGLKVFPNPAPEQNLYDRSDNVSFAKKGIPAINISPGTTGFTEEIQKYYHQVADNPDTVDYDYFIKYCQAYAHAARLVSNMVDRPQWAEGDKYEEAGRLLYEESKNE